MKNPGVIQRQCFRAMGGSAFDELYLKEFTITGRFNLPTRWNLGQFQIGMKVKSLAIPVFELNPVFDFGKPGRRVQLYL